MQRLVLSVLAVLLVGGCSKLVIGEISYDYHPYDGPLVVPDTVMAGSGFLVSVVTSGDGCASQGTTSVDIQGNVATIIPYDYVDRSIFGSCDLVQAWFIYEVIIRFPERGEATVLLRGRYNGTTVTVSRTLWVQ